MECVEWADVCRSVKRHGTFTCQRKFGVGCLSIRESLGWMLVYLVWFVLFNDIWSQ